MEHNGGMHGGGVVISMVSSWCRGLWWEEAGMLPNCAAMSGRLGVQADGRSLLVQCHREVSV